MHSTNPTGTVTAGSTASRRKKLAGEPTARRTDRLARKPTARRTDKRPGRRIGGRIFRPTAHELAAAGILTVFGLLAIWSVQQKSVTWDEAAHFAYGRSLIHHKGHVPASLSRMAVSQLNAAVCGLAHCPDTLPHHGPWLLVARIPTIFLGILLGGLVFAFSRRLYGPNAGLASLILYALSPTALAHTRWVTNDIALTLFFLATLYAFLRYKKSGRIEHLALSALFFGLAQASKFTATLLAPSLLLIHLAGLQSLAQWKKFWSAGSLGRLLLFVVIAWLVLNGSYWFSGTFDSWNSLHLQSAPMQRVGNVLGSLPTFLPRSYLKAFDITFLINATDSGRGYLVLLGQTSRHPFAGYFLYALLFKVPLGALGLLGAALVSLARRKSQIPGNELVLGVPAAILAIYFLFFCGAQIGVRYLLPLIVLGHIFMGRLWVEMPESDPRKPPLQTPKKWAKRLALAAVLVSTLSYYPDFLSFFNVLAPDRATTYRILADSNLEWGQNDWLVRQVMKKRGLPPRTLSPLHPMPGTWVVPGSALAGLRDPARYRWLRPLHPIGVIGHSHFIFHASKSDIIRILERHIRFDHLPLSTPSRRGIQRWDYANRTLSGTPCRQTVAHWIHAPGALCGKRDDFSLRMKTWLRILRSGHYLLGVGSDDGVRLFLSNHLLLDSWSDHGEAWDHVVVHLDPGLYPLRIEYYEHRGRSFLQFYSRNLDNGRSLPLSDFRLVHMAK